MPIGGKQMNLPRAVDAKGEVLDALLQARRDRWATQKLVRKLLKKRGMTSKVWVTDKCSSYGAALRELRFCRAAYC